MRLESMASTGSRRRAEHAARHAVLVVATGLALAVGLVALNNLFVLVLFVAGAAGLAAWRAYEANEVRSEFDASFADAWDATVDALTAGGRVVGEPTWYTITEGVVSAGDATVAIERLPHGAVRLRARVGTFATEDNRRRAALIVEETAERLA